MTLENYIDGKFEAFYNFFCERTHLVYIIPNLARLVFSSKCHQQALGAATCTYQ
jgi:hypothetical protein